MVLLHKTQELSSNSITAMLGAVAQRADLCAEVIDSNLQVIAINRRGLQLLGAQENEVCGRNWTDFWTGNDLVLAKHALSEALAGRNSSFVGTYFGGPEPTIWDIEILPLEWRDGKVATVLALSTNITNAEAEPKNSSQHDPETSDRLGAALHAMSNIITVNLSSARLLRRQSDDPIVLEVAKGLEESAEKARASIASVRRELL